MTENIHLKTFKLPTAELTSENQKDIFLIVHNALVQDFNVDMTRSLFIAPMPNTRINRWLLDQAENGNKNTLMFERLITRDSEFLRNIALTINGDELQIRTEGVA